LKLKAENGGDGGDPKREVGGGPAVADSPAREPSRVDRCLIAIEPRTVISTVLE
jgi:hypothetical protein